MTTLAINDRLLQRYTRAVISELYYWDTKFLKRDTPQLVVRSLSNNQLTVWFKVERTIINRRIFSMHKRDHKLFYAIVDKLRDVLAKLITPIVVAPYSDALANVDGDWPASPYTPPPSAVASPAVLSNLSQKSNDKFAQVTQRIMSNDKPRKASFKTPAHMGRPVISSVYRDSLHAVTSEAGI